MKDDARSTDDRDAAIERLLQRLPGGADAVAPGPCLEPETLAAWMDGALSTADRRIAESHAAGCDDCQAMLAAMVRSEPSPLRPARWWSAGTLRWAVPLVAAGAAVALWFAIDPASLRAPAVAPAAAVVTSMPQPAPASGNLPTAREAPSLPDAASARQPKDRAAAKADESRKKEVELRAGTAPAALDKRLDGSKPAVERRNEAAGTPMAQAAEPSRTARDQFAAGVTAAATDRVIVSPKASTRWRIVSPGRVDRSTDAGATWTVTDLPAGAQVTAGASPAAGVCWLVGRDGLVLRTLDGSTWTRIVFPEPLALAAVEASSRDAALVTSDSGRSFTSSDGGRTWVPRSR